MAEKKTFLLRLDARKMAALEKWAADDFRSVNGQLEWIITRILQEKGRWPGEKPPPESEATPDPPPSV